MDVEREWAHDYVRIVKGKQVNPEAIRKGFQQSLGVQHPERISGFAGFLFQTGDVYASGSIIEFIRDQQFRTFVLESLKRFEIGDYGEISSGCQDQNTENRCLFGIDNVFGNYGYYRNDGDRDLHGQPDEYVRIRKYRGSTWVTFDTEPDCYLFLEQKDLARLADLSCWIQEKETRQARKLQTNPDRVSEEFLKEV